MFFPDNPTFAKEGRSSAVTGSVTSSPYTPKDIQSSPGTSTPAALGHHAVLSGEEASEDEEDPEIALQASRRQHMAQSLVGSVQSHAESTSYRRRLSPAD